MTKTIRLSEPKAYSESFMTAIDKDLTEFIKHNFIEYVSLASKAKNGSVLSSQFV